MLKQIYFRMNLEAFAEPARQKEAEISEQLKPEFLPMPKFCKFWYRH
jgi:hypothetical protein